MTNSNKASVVISIVAIGLSLGSVYVTQFGSPARASEAAPAPRAKWEPRARSYQGEGVAGLWCDLTDRPGEKMAAVYVEKNFGPVIGLNEARGGSSPDMRGHNLAFFLLNGEPYMQVRTKDGGVEHVAFEELVRIVQSERAKKNPPRPLPERVIQLGK